MAKMKKLEDLFHDTLKDVYFAEKKILASLPKMAKAAQHSELKLPSRNTSANRRSDRPFGAGVRGNR